MKPETSDLPLLHASEVVNGHIRPTAATLHVTLTAFKFFSGNAALSKSEELRALADALKKLGLPNDALSLAGATIDVSTGLFSRSSSVTYRAQIRITDIDGLGNVLEVLADAKQARMTHVTWDYPASAPDAMLADCATRAAGKAKVMAATLGIQLGAMHQVRDETHVDATMGQPYLVAGMAVPLARKSRGGGGDAMQSLSGELQGLDLAPTREVSVRVTLAYRLA